MDEYNLKIINYIELVKCIDLFIVVFVFVNIIVYLVYGFVDNIVISVVFVMFDEILKFIVLVMNIKMYYNIII